MRGRFFRGAICLRWSGKTRSGSMSGTGAAVNATAKVGRNEPCPCGSGRKYKHCCQSETSAARSVAIAPQPPAGAKAQTMKKTAGKHWDAGRRADAIAAFQEVVLLDPRNPDASHDLGVALFREGRLAEAMDSLQRAVELRPSFDSRCACSPMSWSTLGRTTRRPWPIAG